MSRFCASCGSDRLHTRHVTAGFWRKECEACGSTGPFAPQPLQQLTLSPDAAWKHSIFCAIRDGHACTCKDDERYDPATAPIPF